MSVSSIADVFVSLSVSPKAPAAIRKAVEAADIQAFQAAYARSVSEPRRRLLKREGHGGLLAMWSVSDIELSSRERELAASIQEACDAARRPALRTGGRKTKSAARMSRYNELLTAWLAEVAGPLDAWEILAVAEMLLREVRVLTADTLVRCLGLLHQSLTATPDVSEADEDGEYDSVQSVRYLLAAGEARWVVSLLLSPIADTVAVAKASSRELEASLMESTDQDGVVHGALIDQLLPWLSCQTRSSIWGRVFRRDVWSKKAARRFASSTERCTLLLLPGGELLGMPQNAEMSDGGCGPERVLASTVLAQAARRAGLKAGNPHRRLIQACRGKTVRMSRQGIRRAASGTLLKTGKQAKKSPVTTTCFQSDPSSVAIMRSGMGTADDVLLAEWDSSQPFLGMLTEGRLLFAGEWAWDLQVRDQPAGFTTTWSCTCWFLDEEVAFAELEAEQKDGTRRSRHLMLALQDQFAILTDTVTVADAEAAVRLTSSVTLADNVTGMPDAVTRELSLASAGKVVRAFPLWLEDDRIQHSLGNLGLTDQGKLQMEAVGRGGATAALVLDWHPKRRHLPADWNKLTVTESRQILADGEACGFRLRVGRHQIMLYRSLKPGLTGRSLLGLHTADESVYGRVPNDGQVVPLVQVEALATP